MKEILKSQLFLVLSLMLSAANAQQPVITNTKIKVDIMHPDDSVRNVNALVFMPSGFEKVIHPRRNKYDSSNKKWIDVYNPKEDIDSAINKVFHGPRYQSKNDKIFIGTNPHWVTVSAFFKFQVNDSAQNVDEAIESARLRANRNLINYKNDWLSGFDSSLEIIPSKTFKTLNADTAFLLRSYHTFKYQSDTPNYKCIGLCLVKYDLGHIDLLYYYPVGQEKKVFKTINDTWGIVQFKPDNEFKSFINEGSIPKQTEPELYYGKFSFVNNPEQFKREAAKYEQKIQKVKSQKMARQSVPLVQSKQYDAAKAKLREALQIDSTNGNIYSQLIYVSIFQNQMDSAWYFWNQYHAIDPHAFNLWYIRGILQQKDNQPDSAAATFEKLLSKDSLNLLVYQSLLNVYSHQQNTEKLGSTFKKVIRNIGIQEQNKKNKKGFRLLNPNQVVQIKLDYAKFLLRQKETDRAISFLNRLVEQAGKQDTSSKRSAPSAMMEYQHIDPKIRAQIYAELGVAYGISNDNQKAKEYLLKAQSLGWEVPVGLKPIIEE